MSTLSLRKPGARPVKPAHDARIEVLGRYLMRRYPDLFVKPVPLSIGIHQKLTLPKGGLKSDLQKFLKAWCSQPAYLEQLVQGGHRYGLNGQDGTVTKQQQKRAETILSRSAVIVKNKRKQQTNRE